MKTLKQAAEVFPVSPLKGGETREDTPQSVSGKQRKHRKHRTGTARLQ
jgi:hypothetical protein